MTYQELVDEGKATMRGTINTAGVENAASFVANRYASPFNAKEHAHIKGMILAAYEAGQLNALQVHKETLESF